MTEIEVIDFLDWLRIKVNQCTICVDDNAYWLYSSISEQFDRNISSEELLELYENYKNEE